jgi:TolB-like protein
MRILATLLLLSVALPAAAQNHPRIAVMPLKAKRIEKDVVFIMDALLVSQLSRLGQFEVISATDIQAMLEAEGMKDALGCDEVTCAAEIGGALNARSTLTGTVGKLGRTIVINLTLFDNERMIPLRRTTVRAKNNEDRFPDAIDAAVGQLFGVDPVAASSLTSSAAPAAEIFQEPGTLEVTSKPVGAYVVVDGKLAGEAPVKVELPPGKHTLNVEKEGFGPYRTTVSVRRGEALRKNAMLGRFVDNRSTREAMNLTGGVLTSVGGLGLYVMVLVTAATGDGVAALITLGFGAMTVAGILVLAGSPDPPQLPLFLRKIDQLERLNAADDRRRTRGVSMAFQF